jgi:phosphate transport system permease protein
MTDANHQVDRTTSLRTNARAPAAAARRRARYRQDRRFKWYGLAALSIATTFLAVLLIDIVSKALPAFTEHRLSADIVIAPDVVAPEGKMDVETLRSADYAQLARTALSALIPGITTRADRKQLNELLSVGATDELRAAVVAKPELVGQTVRTGILLSDTADLYFKGEGTKVVTAAQTRGAATSSGTSGTVVVSSTQDDFADIVRSAKADIAAKAASLRTQADRITAGADDKAVADLRDNASALEALITSGKDIELDSGSASRLIRINDGIIKVASVSAASVKGDVIIPLSTVDAAKPGTWSNVTYTTPEANRNISDRGVAFLEKLKEAGRIERGFNWRFFKQGDSREPELAGIRGAIVGSILTLIVTLGVCLPIGVLAAIYLEEFAPKNKWTDMIEININNLAAVPSIVFGLLGLAVFLNFFGLPRSVPLVGGLVLALLVLPTIIIASRAALRAVPPSIKEAALGLGASKQQAILHHVLPLAMPGIMTGTIIGMAHALGETAPLLMIGMIAFIVDVPSGFMDSATVLPVQIFLWADLPEPAFQAKTAAAILVLLGVLFAMNGVAIWLRKKFEQRW